MSSLKKQETITNLENTFIKQNIPKISIGDTVKVGVKIIEGNKERVQFLKELLLHEKIVPLIQC